MTDPPSHRGSAGRTVALVTGAGRAREIGSAVCRELAGRGHDIAFTVLPGRHADAQELVDALERSGAAVAAIEADLADAAAAAAVLDETGDRLGRTPAVLVNNAAVSVNGGYGAMDARLLDDHYAVNVRAPVLLSCELARRHPARTPGRIVCLTSGQSLGPMLDELPYATTKGALEMFVRQLAPEVMPLGITVNAVNPGVTDTGWITDELRPRVLAQMPSGRLGEPEDAARLIGWLCSDAAGWVTGQVIGSEGGFVRR
ncbi:MAG: SDR family oxidoreductase [Solirubrobacteraceae bacterium]